MACLHLVHATKKSVFSIQRHNPSLNVNVCRKRPGRGAGPECLLFATGARPLNQKLDGSGRGLSEKHAIVSNNSCVSRRSGIWNGVRYLNAPCEVLHAYLHAAFRQFHFVKEAAILNV